MAAATAAATSGAPPPPAPSAPAAAHAPSITAPMDAKQVLDILDQTVDWYRTLGIQQQLANEPSDLLILYENRQTANEVLGLAFDLARADAAVLDQEPGAAPAGDAPPGSQAMTQLRAKLDAQERSAQSEFDAARRQLTTAPKKAAAKLQAKVAELQGELDLINIKKSMIGNISSFENGGAAGSNASKLRAQIDAMAVALPSANAAPASPTGATSEKAGRPAGGAISNPLPAASAAAPAPSRFGLWDLASRVFILSEKMTALDDIDRRTGALQTTLAQVRTRLADQLRALSARGDALVAQADTADSGALNGVREQLDTLTDQFKEASAIFVPLSKESVLLSQYRHNLKTWRDATQSQSRAALKTLGVRVGVLAIILTIVFAFTELWRRAVLKYVPDARRRYQLMLVRRIAFWSLVIIIVGFAFASELGSIVTFAGLITAGLAVAMQSVLVSIVGYFFLIGKHGIRVGDRVQIGEVYGEVIELGLVRMYLMELGGRGSLGPTGRVVAYANSIVFQVATGLFKQIPGVDFAWHDITLSLPPAVDYAATKQKLNDAVRDALEDYHDEIQRQTRQIQRTIDSSHGADIVPTVQLSYSVDGVQAHVRYPVHLSHAAEIDERVSQALLQVISTLTPTATHTASPSSNLR